MKRKKTNHLRLGVFVTLGMAVFIFAIYYIGAKNNLIGKTIAIKGIFNDVSGLRIGNNVRYSGINVGTVTGISLANDSLVLVELSIDTDFQHAIKKNSRMIIASEGVMGNRVINIMPGSPDAAPINIGDNLPTLEAIKTDAILQDLKRSSQNASQLTKNLVAISEKINRGEGLFGKLFTDTALRNNITRISINTSNLTEDFAQISTKLNQQQSALGKLLTDTTLGENIEKMGHDLEASAQHLNSITSKIDQGEGIFGKIFTDTSFTSNLNQASQHLNYTTAQSREIADNLKAISGELAKGGGLIKRLIYDSAFADSVETTVYNINKSAKELDEAAKKVKNNWFIRLFTKKE